MPESSNAKEDLSLGLRSIFERVGEFFHIFDLSFLVAGASTFAAGSFLYVMMHKPSIFPFEPWVGAAALVIACYLCGLIAFSVGRELSGLTFRRHTLHKTLPASLTAHQLSDAGIGAYQPQQDEARHWWLYIRMWSEVAHDASAPVVLHHLMRYWAMAATYDGVAFSFLAWASVLTAVQFKSVAPQPLGHGVGVSGVVIAGAAAYFAFRRGAAYFEYQIEDVVAHFAVKRGSLVTPAK